MSRFSIEDRTVKAIVEALHDSVALAEHHEVSKLLQQEGNKDLVEVKAFSSAAYALNLLENESGL